MRIYKTKGFQRWAMKQALTDNALLAAVEEIKQGLVDADLGGHIVKKRVGTQGRGKRDSVRTLLAFQLDDKAFFIYGFSKNERSNITQKELKALKLLASVLLDYTSAILETAVKAGELIEVSTHG